MKTRIIKLLIVVFVFQLTSCKNEGKLPEFKYADQPATVTCNANLDALLKEALYSFENDILEKHDPRGKNLTRAYRTFLNNALSNRGQYETTVSEHSKQLFEVLKTKSELWDLNSPVSNLNYSSDLVTCLGNNIKNKGLKSTFNSLTSTNFMSPKLFGEPLKSASLTNDKNLATYAALEFYYAKLFNVDLTNVKDKATDNTNSPTQPVEEDPHAGHNHD